MGISSGSAGAPKLKIFGCLYARSCSGRVLHSPQLVKLCKPLRVSATSVYVKHFANLCFMQAVSNPDRL